MANATINLKPSHCTIYCITINHQTKWNIVHLQIIEDHRAKRINHYYLCVLFCLHKSAADPERQINSNKEKGGVREDL
jgi:hypothetical protein